MLLLPLVYLALGLAPFFEPGITSPEPARSGFGVDRLLHEVASFRRRFLQGGGDQNTVATGDAAGLIADLEAEFKETEAAQRKVLTALLDLHAAALERRAKRGLEMAYDREEASLMRLTEGAIHPKLRDLDLGRFVTREVLVIPSLHSASRRAAAAYQYRNRKDESALLALLQATRGEDELLNYTSLETLCTWDHSTVHKLMVSRLGQQLSGKLSRVRFAERHFRSVRLEEGSRAEGLLVQYVKRALGSNSWRQASLGVSVSRGLEPRTAAPILIMGLELWNRKGEQEGGTLRIRHSLASALHSHSGRNLGLRVDRWQAWWRAVESGEIKLAEAAIRVGGQQFTKTGFFGIDPKSDRVTFVLDRSGSMDSAFTTRSGTGKGPALTRYKEATKQLLKFLEGMGGEGRFSVVLFSDKATVWRTKLQPASPTNRRAIRKWLALKSPDGGTFLRDGVHRAFQIDRRGKLDLKDLEADTVVVLCDGATTEGSGWVKPFLERTNSQARVTFHCIQIGAGGDGTLQLLAKETGGEFRRIAH